MAPKNSAHASVKTDEDPPSGPDAAKDPQFAYTLAKGLAVLRAFDVGSMELGNREIAERIGIGRQTVVRLTRTLALLGYLKYNAASARYRLAATVLSLGYPLLSQLNVRQFMRPHMQELADFARGAVSLGMRADPHMILIETCVDRLAPSGRPDVGATRGFDDTSMGRAYYSAASDAERAEIDAVLQSRPDVDWRVLQPSLAQSRQQFADKGYCTWVSAGAGIEAIAVPLRGLHGDELLVVNCAVARFQLKPDTLDTQIAPRLFHLVGLVLAASGRR